eukprot:TRINITY_DN20661_c0_g1_i1.p1 TRINITY_DN20661_c0_g1~~TRINITY_DN20661_c0_g1_i1.p1  ORF type:complete len:617 (+),score=140.47 TRINITY_DN20661_c0_g1_i1:87-1937(+)
MTPLPQYLPPESQELGLHMKGEMDEEQASRVARAKQIKKGNKMNVGKLHCAPASVAVSEPTTVGLRWLEEDVMERIRQSEPTAQSQACMERCMRDLHGLAGRLGPNWQVKAFGSAANGFVTRASDLDVTCCQAGAKLGDDSQRQAAATLGDWILPTLQALYPSFRLQEEILAARVPILKLRFEDKLDVDLSCHNVKPLKNTRLLKAYSTIDKRILNLGLAIKLWAKATDVCGSSGRNLSSYAFNLLVIYFMHVHPDVQLPLLRADVFDGSQDALAEGTVQAAQASWHCRLSLPELLVRFFRFYASEFDWGREVASVRYGKRLNNKDATFAQLRGVWTARLHIEDPYEIYRNHHCTLGETEEQRLRDAFAAALKSIEAGQTPAGLRPVAAVEQDAMKTTLDLRKVLLLDDEISRKDSATTAPKSDHSSSESTGFAGVSDDENGADSENGEGSGQSATGDADVKAVTTTADAAAATPVGPLFAAVAAAEPVQLTHRPSQTAQELQNALKQELQLMKELSQQQQVVQQQSLSSPQTAAAHAPDMQGRPKEDEPVRQLITHPKAEEACLKMEQWWKHLDNQEVAQALHALNDGSTSHVPEEGDAPAGEGRRRRWRRSAKK